MLFPLSVLQCGSPSNWAALSADGCYTWLAMIAETDLGLECETGSDKRDVCQRMQDVASLGRKIRRRDVDSRDPVSGLTTVS